MKTYKVHHDYTAEKNSVIDKINIGEFVDIKKYPLKKAWINTARKAGTVSTDA